MYVLAGVREQQARIDDAIKLFERVVQYDHQYQLPKLQENMQRLAALQERQSRDIAPAHLEADISPSSPKPAEAGFCSHGTASVPDAPGFFSRGMASGPDPPGSLKGEIDQA